MPSRFATLLLLGTIACGGSSPTGPGAEAQLTSQVTVEGLRLTNSGDYTLYYQPFEKEWADHGLFIWGICTEPASCLSIAAHGSTTVPFLAIDGYTTEARAARVYVWELAPAANGKHDVRNLHSVVVDL